MAVMQNTVVAVGLAVKILLALARKAAVPYSGLAVGVAQILTPHRPLAMAVHGGLTP